MYLHLNEANYQDCLEPGRDLFKSNEVINLIRYVLMRQCLYQALSILEGLLFE